MSTEAVDIFKMQVNHIYQKKIIQIQLHPRETNLLFDIWLIGVFCYADGAMKNFRTRLNRQRTHLTLSVRPAGYLWTSWESPNF